MYTNLRKFDLAALFLPVPPMFEKAVGYNRESRFVAFFWDYCGDELQYLDETMSYGTIDYQGWLIFQRNQMVRLHLLQYDFGSSEVEALHWLLLDRKERRFFVGLRAEVESFLKKEAFPEREPKNARAVISKQKLAELSLQIEQLNKSNACPEIILSQMKEQHVVCEELKKWLARFG